MTNKTERTYTTKTSLEELQTAFVDLATKTVKRAADMPSDLVQRVNYTIKKARKDETSIDKRTLIDLCNDIQTALASLAVEEQKPKKKNPFLALFDNITANEPAPVESSLKPAKKPQKPIDEQEEQEEQPKKPTKKVDKQSKPKTKKEALEEQETEQEEKPKASLKKPAAKTKKEEKPAIVETKDKLSKQSRTLAKVFPQVINDKNIGKLIACRNEYQTIDSIRDALEAGKQLVIAGYWTKRDILQFNYSESKKVKCPATFPNDLDLIQIVIVCDNNDMLYAMSSYTEAMYTFLEEDLEPLEDSDGNDKFTIRISEGMEFEIYELAD